MKLLHPPDFERQPWKNGGGVTTELARQPRHDAGGWLWRLSIAEVDRSGPFSDFSGYRRTIMLLDGAGMVLAFDEAPAARIERRHEPFEFDGGWRADCTLLDGPVKDMNLIVDTRRARGRIAVHHLDRATADVAPRASWCLLYGLEGATDIDARGRRLRLETATLLRLDDAREDSLRLAPATPASALALITLDEHTTP